VSAARALEELAALVAIDSRNPPRDAAAIAAHVEARLRGAFEIDVRDLGGGSICVHARRGAPRVVFNFHVDTVPAAPGWSASPFALRVEGDRARGLGACDTKGAAAAMMATALETAGDLALLFTTDEEAGQAACVRDFIARGLPYELVVVAEPTSCKAALAHRGIATATLTFRGRAGHASAASIDSATHALGRWMARALDATSTAAQGPLLDARFNVGTIAGGVKANVVAAEATAKFGVRPPPAMDPSETVDALAALAPDAELARAFLGPPLREHAAARAFAERFDLAVAPPVDFWTEAALFAEAGYPAIVLGAGDIAQAHAANESVPIADLERLTAVYARMIRGAS
jgi:acetylornithine deacetylase